MLNLLSIIVLLAQIANPASPSNVPLDQENGLMPEVVATAPRYQYEDVAWGGMMDEVVVIAQRFEGEDVAYGGMMDEVVVDAPRYLQDQNLEAKAYRPQTRQIRFELAPKFAYAQEYDINPKLAGMTLSGDYELGANDTIDDDVTVTGGNAQIDGVIDGDLAVIGGEVGVSGSVDGDVAVFGGDLTIKGIISGDAVVFGGSIHNLNTIEGDLAVVGGSVVLDSGSVVKGDINMVGGSVDRDTNAVVLGEIESIEMQALERILPRIGRLGRAFRWHKQMPGSAAISGIIGLAIMIVLYIIHLLAAIIFPKAVDQVVEKTQSNAWAAVGLGLGVQILFVPIIALLAVSVIGIPLIPLFVLGVFVACLFGFSSLSLIIGERIAKGLHWQVNTKIGLFTIGWITAMLIFIVGIIFSTFGLSIAPAYAFGGIVIYVIATIGIGGVIYALIKKNGKTTNK